jgi:Transposase and inactivated derivatives, TnpA family
MPTKTILSPAQRAAIFDPPLDRATIERLYTLGPDDPAQVARRRRGANRIGYAVQLCYLRHHGRGLLTGENVPDTMLALGSEIAASTDRGEAIATGMVDRLERIGSCCRRHRRWNGSRSLCGHGRARQPMQTWSATVRPSRKPRSNI